MIKVLKNMRTTTLRCWNFTSKIGTITLFAFDRGQGLSEHTAPFDFEDGAPTLQIQTASD